MKYTQAEEMQKFRWLLENAAVKIARSEHREEMGIRNADGPRDAHSKTAERHVVDAARRRIRRTIASAEKAAKWTGV